ncbi:MAG TPA: tetratricopeptide repeat protein [Nitrospira sp.]|nr:tetratricopeptide repeat protein [Nitrospira sp.]
MPNRRQRRRQKTATITNPAPNNPSSEKKPTDWRSLKLINKIVAIIILLLSGGGGTYYIVSKINLTGQQQTVTNSSGVVQQQADGDIINHIYNLDSETLAKAFAKSRGLQGGSEVRKHEEDLEESVDKKADEKLQQIKEAIDALKELAKASAPRKQPAIKDALEQLKDGNADLAMQTFQEVLDQQKSVGKSAYKEAAAAAMHIGHLASATNSEKAIPAFRQATELEPDSSEAWNQLANALQRMDKNDEAVDALKKVLAFAQQKKDLSWQAITHHNLGIVYANQGKYEDAEEMYLRALNINRELGRKSGVAYNYNSLALLNGQKGKNYIGEDYALDSVNTYSEIRHLTDMEYAGLGDSLGTLAHFHAIRKDFRGAENLYCESFAIYKKLKNDYRAATVYQNLGLLYQNEGQLVRAASLFKRSAVLARSVNNTGQTQRARSSLAALPADVVAKAADNSEICNSSTNKKSASK